MTRAAGLTVGLEVSGLEPGFKAHAQRGIGRYIRELKAALERQAPAGIQLEPFSRDKLRSSSLALEALRIISNTAPLGRTTLRQQCLFPLQLSSRFDVVHFPAHMDAPAWGMNGYVLTVLDLIPLVCADLYKANRTGIRFLFARYLELKAIRNATVIVAISESTSRDVQRILGVPAERIVVTPLAADRKFFRMDRTPDLARQKLQLPQGRPVVLYVGGIDPRKNIAFMLLVFKELLQVPLPGRPLLVMAGNIATDREYPRLQKELQTLGLKDDVLLTGYVDDDVLLSLYTAASVFFFPSLYEGFGLPALEAMAAGLPVVSSNTSSMPEVIGEAGMLFSPTDERAALEGLRQVLERGETSVALAEKGREQAARFTWDRTAQETVKAYRMCASLLGRGGR